MGSIAHRPLRPDEKDALDRALVDFSNPPRKLL
jgi:hypothetical protein